MGMSIPEDVNSGLVGKEKSLFFVVFCFPLTITSPLKDRDMFVWSMKFGDDKNYAIMDIRFVI